MNRGRKERHRKQEIDKEKGGVMEKEMVRERKKDIQIDICRNRVSDTESLGQRQAERGRERGKERKRLKENGRREKDTEIKQRHRGKDK